MKPNDLSFIQLKDINLGSIDAKNEILSHTPEEVERLKDSFVIPPSLLIDRFIDRSKYYVTGLKGTGKTALLRYISAMLDEDECSGSVFILFKSEIDEDTRVEFSRARNVVLVEENSSKFDEEDYEVAWRWVIYKRIVRAIQEKIINPFQDTPLLADFIELVCIESQGNPLGRGVSNLFPRIRKGQIEISKSPKLKLDLVWDENEKANVRFIELVKRADSIFQDLSPSPNRLNIFFDELEIGYSNSKQFRRDSRLIRDLIVSLERINAISKSKGFEICVYAAIRSEVLMSVESLGKEINKPIADFGFQLLWNRSGMDFTQQPLLKIVENRINNARKEHGLKQLDSTQLWSQYFPSEIQSEKPQQYILHNSWYRPRDVVRLLLEIKDQYPYETRFSVNALESIRKAYSKASWVEITEELKVEYTPEDIDGIKSIFYGFKQISSISDLRRRSEEIANGHKNTAGLLKRNSLEEVLKKLYRIGAIGNIDRKNYLRFSFRGDDEMLFDRDVFIHRALRSFFSV